MTRPMRLLLLTDTAVLAPGGSERFTRNLVCQLPPDRWAIDVLQLIPEPAPERRVVASLDAPHVRLVHWPVGAIYGPQGLAAFARLCARVAAGGYDVIQSQHEKADLMNALLPRLVGGPVRISSRRDMGFQKTDRLRQAFRRLNGRYDRIVAPSRAILDGLVTDEAAAPERLVEIPNGVDTARFRVPDAATRDAARAREGLSPDAFVVLCVASLSPIKRHEDLIAGFATLHAAQPNARLLLAGDGPLADALAAQATALGLGDAVRFLGVRDDVGGLLSAADVFVLASDSEGMSNAILEAQACGLPVVATRVGGNPQLVAEGAEGFLVPARDPAGLARALAACGDPAWRQSAGRRARARIEREHSIPAMAARYDELYRSLLEAPAVLEGALRD
ncbi:MAG: glycosyltransferase [Burkholderiales bacterium]|nr:MAG: glycosyltransferase [Burkholderiales bacterium]